MYYKLSDSDIRSACKEKIESLEYWLRRVIDDILSQKFRDYFNYKDDSGNKIIKSELHRTVLMRKAAEPNRYPRLIDAVLLDDAIKIICNPSLYKRFFKDVLGDAFPTGETTARFFMERLLGPRNALAHANPISIRSAEQIICYSNDIIDSIKKYYTIKNMDNDYNVPLILKVTDSFGKAYFRTQMTRNPNGGISMDFVNDPNYFLRVGDILTLELEIDPSFDETDYTLTWSSAKGFNAPVGNSKKAVFNIGNKQVGQSFDIQCRIKSKKEWHRLTSGIDDLLIFRYKVLPPK